MAPLSRSLNFWHILLATVLTYFLASSWSMQNSGENVRGQRAEGAKKKKSSSQEPPVRLPFEESAPALPEDAADMPTGPDAAQLSTAEAAQLTATEAHAPKGCDVSTLESPFAFCSSLDDPEAGPRVADELVTKAQRLLLTLNPRKGYVESYVGQEKKLWMPELVLSMLHHACELQKEGHLPGRHLDIGPAYGTLLTLFSEVTGQCSKPSAVDFFQHYMSEEAVVHIMGGGEEGSADYRMFNVESEDFPTEWEESFDTIILTDVLQAFNFNALPTLQKIRRLLKPWGALFISSPAGRNPSSKFKSWQELPQAKQQKSYFDGLVYGWSTEDVHALLTEAGFSVDCNGLSSNRERSQHVVVARRQKREDGPLCKRTPSPPQGCSCLPPAVSV